MLQENDLPALSPRGRKQPHLHQPRMRQTHCCPGPVFRPNSNVAAGDTAEEANTAEGIEPEPLRKSSIELIQGANIEDIVPRQHATYQEIQKWVEQHHGFQLKTCWIAHCVELQGIPLREAVHRRGTERLDPCPPDKRTAIIQAFRHFGMLP
jgi:hypothetical protein